MPHKEPEHRLPRIIDHNIAVLSKLYGREGRTQLQEILVNAQVRVQEGWTYDKWDGGTYGHALSLVLPEPLFLGNVRNAEEICGQIKTDLNKINNIPNEFIADVFFEMQPIENQDWRTDSGLLLSHTRSVSEESQNRIWGETGYRIFLSHKTEFKKETAGLKEKVRIFGTSCFVAHEDIHPTKAWQDEIENALSTMDAFVALLTEGFHDSLWTDQEVGYALGRGVPIIAVKLGKDPYGFIGKFQALSCDWEQAPFEIVKLLAEESKFVEFYVKAIINCDSWNTGNEQAKLLPFIQKLSDDQIQRLCVGFNTNHEMQGSWGFNGGFPSAHGGGLAEHFTRITGKSFIRSKDTLRQADE